MWTTLAVASASPLSAQQAHDYLANNVLLIVRHSEKLVQGSGLTPQGEARAKAYVTYFQKFHDGDLAFSVDGLFAGADSEASVRPRLTLEPLHTATGMVLHDEISTKDSPKLVAELREHEHGTHPLISWRHGQIPTLLTAFGATPDKLLPGGKWPDDVFDWVIALSFDGSGKLKSERLIHEDLKVVVP
jgi:broad specificity phosphatase PhoE